jgi:hypothetical protein
MCLYINVMEVFVCVYINLIEVYVCINEINVFDDYLRKFFKSRDNQVCIYFRGTKK